MESTLISYSKEYVYGNCSEGKILAMSSELKLLRGVKQVKANQTLHRVYIYCKLHNNLYLLFPDLLYRLRKHRPCACHHHHPSVYPIIIWNVCLASNHLPLYLTVPLHRRHRFQLSMINMNYQSSISLSMAMIAVYPIHMQWVHVHHHLCQNEIPALHRHLWLIVFQKSIRWRRNYNELKNFPYEVLYWIACPIPVHVTFEAVNVWHLTYKIYVTNKNYTTHDTRLNNEYIWLNFYFNFTKMSSKKSAFHLEGYVNKLKQ